MASFFIFKTYALAVILSQQAKNLLQKIRFLARDSSGWCPQNDNFGANVVSPNITQYCRTSGTKGKTACSQAP